MMYKGYEITYERDHVVVHDITENNASWTEDTVHDAMLAIDELEEKEE